MQFQSCWMLFLLSCCVHGAWCIFGDELDDPDASRGSALRFIELFGKCVRFTPEFDDCVKDAINNARDFYSTGVPELDLPPIEPWHLADVEMIKNAFELNLTDIQESSWQESTINVFKSNLKPGGYIQFSQFCPEMVVEGHYRALGKGPDAKGFQDGTWNFTLYDMHRTLVITRNKLSPEKFKVKLSILEISDAQLHIGNSEEDDPEKDYVDNQFLNSFWMFGFPMVKPMVEELLASAYSKKYTEMFSDFNWDELFPRQVK